MKQDPQFNSSVPASTSSTSRGATTPTAVEHVARTVKITATQKVWPVLEDLIRVADAANIPVCGGAFGALTYLIDAFNEVQDNKDAYAQLEAILENYTKTLNDFILVLPASYLSSSTKHDAVIARDAIKAFNGHGEFVEAEVDGTDRVVKLFRGEKGERAFLDALAFMQKNR
ncbi:hypothetical protein FRB99_000224 [Tulasnella sp. 403]|nr:hypothetical protein FRB99_000224 [Tulasnella sp. 403]